MTIVIENARQPEIERLLVLSEQYAESLYPPDSCYLLDVSELEAPGVAVYVARVDGEAIGMGAIVIKTDGSAELKRLFVEDRARGRGLAAGLLEALEKHALDAGVRLVQLETGPKSLPAIALYEKHGYGLIPNFGQYIGDEFSYCMQKQLS